MDDRVDELAMRSSAVLRGQAQSRRLERVVHGPAPHRLFDRQKPPLAGQVGGRADALNQRDRAVGSLGNG
jgi:hypothetical protein